MNLPSNLIEGVDDDVGDGFGVGVGTSVVAGAVVVVVAGDAVSVDTGITGEGVSAGIDGEVVSVIVAAQPASSNAAMAKTASKPSKILFFIIENFFFYAVRATKRETQIDFVNHKANDCPCQAEQIATTEQ